MDLRENSPLNIADRSVDIPVQTPWYRKRITFVVASIVGLLAVLVLAGAYGDYIGAKVAPGKKFKILGPSVITAGQKAAITWDASTEDAKQYPYEKIEYCFGAILKRKCILLASAVPNNGKAIVSVPASLQVGKGYFKFTARDPKKKLFAAFTANSSAVTVKPAVVVKKEEVSSGDSDGGGGSGNGGSGGSGGGSGGNGDTGGGSNNAQAENSVTNYELTHLCYESDQTLHISWKPPKSVVRFRKSGESSWLPDINQCGFNGCKDVAYWTYDDYKVAIIYISSQLPLPPSTDFEFQIVPYYSSPDGSPENSQVYKFNSGPLPSFGVCRSLL